MPEVDFTDCLHLLKILDWARSERERGGERECRMSDWTESDREITLVSQVQHDNLILDFWVHVEFGKGYFSKWDISISQPHQERMDKLSIFFFIFFVSRFSISHVIFHSISSFTVVNFKVIAIHTDPAAAISSAYYNSNLSLSWLSENKWASESPWGMFT